MSVLILLLHTAVGGAQYTPSTLLVPPYKITMGYHRASRFYLSLYLGGNFTFKNPQGLTSTLLKMYDDTTTARDDGNVTLFGVHSGAGEILYNVKFEKLMRYGKPGSGEGEFMNPLGIAATPDGDVYVADAGNNRVVHLKYNADGSITWKGAVGSGFNHPSDVAVDSRGNVYVADEENNRVVVLDPSGNVRNKWELKLFRPRSIAVIDRDDPANDNRDNFVIVIDGRQKRLSMFDPYGDLKAQITNKEMGYEDVQFAYVAIDRSGSVYVTDSYNHQVHKFDHKLNYIISIGREGSDDYEFYSPRGIAIHRPTGQVFISEAEGGQYYFIAADGFIAGCYPDPFPIEKGTTISIYLTETSTIEVSIHDEQGTLVRKLAPQYKQPIGEALIAWDGRNDRGQRVAPGRYIIKASLKPANLSGRFFKKELEATVRCVTS